MTEDSENIVITCPDCVKKLYPSAGKFTQREVKFARFVKKAFGREHMWVKVHSMDEKGVRGTVDNAPVLEGSPKFGDWVEVKFAEIEDVA